jgi:serine/threonine protein kinase
MDVRVRVVWAARSAQRTKLLRIGDHILIGRSSEADIQLEHGSVSREHARLSLSLKGLRVVDLGSTNGTFAGDEGVTDQPVQLAKNAWLRIGEVEVRVDFLRPSEWSSHVHYPAFLPREDFELQGVIGEGGSSVVYAAVERSTGRRVAIKRLRANVGADTDEFQRFLHEADLYSQVDSPYVIRLYTLRRDGGGQPYMVMELAPGGTLLEELSRPLTLARALGVAEQVALGLKAIHEVGIVHRDVKPGNVLLTIDGDAKLGDLGIARDLTLGTITPEGLGLGTIAYVAPEQALSAREATPAADLYSLGALLFHMTTGETPLPDLAGEQLTFALERLANERPPRASSLVSQLPHELDDLLEELLLKEPEERTLSAGHVAGRLAAIRERRCPVLPTRSRATARHAMQPPE